MSFVISAVVHIVLVVGLWAAIREFQQASRTRKRQDETEINVSAEGVALKTSLHGTLLLVTCIGLDLLYLRFIYPINGS